MLTGNVPKTSQQVDAPTFGKFTKLSQPKPSASQPEPSTSQHEPSTSQHEPSTSQHEPSTSQHEPSTSQPKPSTSQHEPSTSQPKPSTSQPDNSQKLEERDLLKVARLLGCNWWQVGIFLGIESTQLGHIRYDFSGNVQEQSFQMLLFWSTHCDPQEVTVDTLRIALEEAECLTALKCLSLHVKGIIV
ncbi:uncharacterized protein LOC106878668 [Octopus bimaculoides]|uniref:Death domain-containing protein n=1 Tax=Octopus bimaculoides TaxID=37653 RepID=A0A0L8G7P4_OCTBM|nr:uncharacterized protein LOC106878668 [Octopus bimaculoides]|eukprot:XP_014783439.1 PREDICTED: uncharacterized protein LOC106878668 [Octopus bimaculoides]